MYTFLDDIYVGNVSHTEFGADAIANITSL